MSTHSSVSTKQHKIAASQQGPIAVAIVTVSDTRTPETDENGKYLKRVLEASGQRVVGYSIIPDDPNQVKEALEKFVSSSAQVIFFNGGTGIAPRDTTFDVIDKKLEKKLPGFGELFRMLSFKQVGSAAMLSRAVAGVYRNKVIISTPGSPAAVKLAWEKLIEPELAHLAWEVTRKK